MFELPFLRSLGVGPRHTGRREIAGLIHQLLKLYPNFAFGPDDTRVLIQTPEKTFAEMLGTGAPLRLAERSINWSLDTWRPRLVRSNCCANASIRWRWRRRNCRMERPISHHPATRCTLSDEQIVRRFQAARPGHRTRTRHLRRMSALGH